MHGVSAKESPGRYGGHIAVMREMSWSWADLQNAPADLVDEIMLHMHYRNHWESKSNEMRAKQ